MADVGALLEHVGCEGRRRPTLVVLLAGVQGNHRTSQHSTKCDQRA